MTLLNIIVANSRRKIVCNLESQLKQATNCIDLLLKRINDLNDDLSESQKLNRYYEDRIMELEQEKSALYLQLEDWENSYYKLI